jgi:hypothetical protein
MIPYHSDDRMTESIKEAPMNRRSFLCLAFALLLAPAFVPAAPAADKIMDLAGPWILSLDAADAGLAGRWFSRLPSSESSAVVRLPGSLAENGQGQDISPETAWTGAVDKSWFTSPVYAPYRVPGNVKFPFWLNPVKHFVGPAWYQRDVTIPREWEGRRIVLFLERAHWRTRVWLDDAEIGTCDSLSVPHVYDLGTDVAAGRHRLTVRVDNRLLDVNVGVNAHSVTDHTQSNWNGVAGRIGLRAGAPLFIEDIRVYADTAGRRVRAVVTIGNSTGRLQSGNVVLSARLLNTANAQERPPFYSRFSAPAGRSSVELVYPLGPDAPLWDEFAPNVFELTAGLRGLVPGFEDEQVVRFGFRDFKAAGTRFSVNGRPIFLRGTLECCIFPRTGYPAATVDEWKRIYGIIKAHGLNHMRFHSWCPPEAAFAAADEMGVYLYVECAAWATVGDGKAIDAWLYKESERIVQAYGNHPSFCMMSYGNEPGGEASARYLADFVNYWKNKDGRRLYTSAAGWPALPENDFHVTAEPRIQRWGEGLNSVINKQAPQTLFDFREIIGKFDKPAVGHEIGQWCVYPNLQEIVKYTGVLKAKNFEIFRDTLEAAGMGPLAADFLAASGKLQALCYKADIEAALRTPGFAGFELLDLHDFPGQGTALVGVLDPFWEEKGYITPEEFRRFCAPTVPLLRLAKMIFLDSEELSAAAEAAHFGPAPLIKAAPQWTVVSAKGQAVRQGTLPVRDIPIGNAVDLGTIRLKLSGLSAPARYRLNVRIGENENGWDFWVYPTAPAAAPPAEVMVSRRLDDRTAARLAAGGKVLLILEKGVVKPEKGGSVALGFSSIFWNTAWTNGQPPHTLGLLCDPNHPALESFPTEFHSNWQWWDLIAHGQAVRLDDFGPGFAPIVRIIDDWFTNRPLGLIFEVRVGPGKLLVCAADLLTDAETRPEARQLLASLLKYAASHAFLPAKEAGLEVVRGLFKE